MTKDEELQALREENRTLKALVAELLPLKEQVAQAHARIKELEDRLAKDSRTSSKLPSSDGLARLPRRSRRPSGKHPAGQMGHAGHTLSMIEQPDDVVRHRPQVCSQCHADESDVPGSVAERRQVLDVPEIRPAFPRTSDRGHLLPNVSQQKPGQLSRCGQRARPIWSPPASVGGVSAPGAIAPHSSHEASRSRRSVGARSGKPA